MTLWDTWFEQQLDKLYKWKDSFGKYVNGIKDYLNVRIDNIRSDLSDLSRDVDSLPARIDSALGSMREAILSTVDDIYIKPLAYYVDALKMDVVDWIGGLDLEISTVWEDIEHIFDFIGQIDSIIDTRIDGFKDKIISWIEDKFIWIIEQVLEQEVKQ